MFLRKRFEIFEKEEESFLFRLPMSLTLAPS